MERAENPVVPREGRSTGISILPRELRVPILGARLLLTGLALGSSGAISGSSIADAAEPNCKGALWVVGIKFADHPTLGRDRILDLTDFYLGNADFRVAEIYDRAGKNAFDKWDKKDSSAKPKPIASGNMSDRGAYSLATISFSGDCDEDRGQAKRVWLGFELDNKLTLYPEVVRNGTTRLHMAGRDEHRISALQAFADDKNFRLEKAGQFIGRISKEVAGTTIPFTDPDQLVGNANVISEANRAKLREQIAKLIKQEAEEKKKAQAQTPTPTGTSTPTSTPTGTPSSTPSRIPERTGTPTGTPTVPDRSPTATGSPTQTRTPTREPADATPTVQPLQTKLEAETKPDTKPDGSRTPPPSTFDNVVSGAKKFAGDIAGRAVEGTGLPRSIREGAYYFEKIRIFLNI